MRKKVQYLEISHDNDRKMKESADMEKSRDNDQTRYVYK